MPTEAEELLKKLSGYSSEIHIPEGKSYTPPDGIPILQLPPSAKFYTVDPPSKQRDLLASFERRHTIPIAMLVAPCFGVNPVPDDVYRAAPEMHKNNLFVIFSRSGIKRDGSTLRWDAIVAVVKKLCVVRICCSLDAGLDRFSLDKILLWSRKQQDYSEVKDPAGKAINPNVLPFLLERYIQIEGIA